MIFKVFCTKKNLSKVTSDLVCIMKLYKQKKKKKKKKVWQLLKK